MSTVDTRLASNAAVLLGLAVACLDPNNLTYCSYRYASEPPVLPGENSLVVYVAGPHVNPDPGRSRGDFITYEVEYRFVLTRSFVGILTVALKDGQSRWATPQVRDQVAGTWINDVATLFNCLAAHAPGVLDKCHGPFPVESFDPVPDGDGFRTVIAVRASYRPSQGCVGPGC